MERSSEVILRNESDLPPGELLLINPPRDSLAQRLARSGRQPEIFTQHHGDYCWHASQGSKVQFGLLPDPSDTPASAILVLAREKELLAMMLHSLSSSAMQNLWLVGENKAGIKSARRWLERSFSQVEKLDSARHCGLFTARNPVASDPFLVGDYEQRWRADYAACSLEVISLPGVFAHGRLDQGSRLLLKALEPLRPAGKVLDFACGSGVIGCSLLAADPGCQLTLLDVSALAIESSRRTLEANSLAAELLPSEGLDQVQDKFDWIVSNPPFHRGIHSDLEIAADFFARAGTFLTENGKIVIVCNRHLPYSNALRNHFGQVERLSTDDRFSVILAAKPLNS